MTAELEALARVQAFLAALAQNPMRKWGAWEVDASDAECAIDADDLRLVANLADGKVDAL